MWYAYVREYIGYEEGIGAVQRWWWCDAVNADVHQGGFNSYEAAKYDAELQGYTVR